MKKHLLFNWAYGGYSGLDFGWVNPTHPRKCKKEYKGLSSKVNSPLARFLCTIPRWAAGTTSFTPMPPCFPHLSETRIRISDGFPEPRFQAFWGRSLRSAVKSYIFPISNHYDFRAFLAFTKNARKAHFFSTFSVPIVLFPWVRKNNVSPCIPPRGVCGVSIVVCFAHGANFRFLREISPLCSLND